MKYLVTPEFNEKVASLPADGRTALSAIVEFVGTVDKQSLNSGSDVIEVRSLGSDIITLRRGAYRIYASLGKDKDGDYLLFLDISQEATRSARIPGFFASKDPRSNPMFDPNRNMMIDPRRNMMIDPNRNMMIDPRRNMMIDPNRNMMIDPRRNMMIDPNRNMMIDPRRNMMIDPNRNMMIDPRRNRFYGGPYVYNSELEQIGFGVRANDQVSLVFDLSGGFSSYIVSNASEGANVFDLTGRWQEFLVHANQDVRLRFDLKGQWLGLVL